MNRIVLVILVSFYILCCLDPVFGQENTKLEILSNRKVTKVISSSAGEVWSLDEKSEMIGLILLVKIEIKGGAVIVPNNYFVLYKGSKWANCEGNLISSEIKLEGDWAFAGGRISRIITRDGDGTEFLNLLFIIPKEVSRVTLMRLQPITEPTSIK